MDYLVVSSARRISGSFLRLSLAIILAWIGALKFVDPSSVVELLQASLPFLALNVMAMAPGHARARVAQQAVAA
jgi:uncharacterized membrane protein YkgB